MPSAASNPVELTRLLRAFGTGDQGALEELTPIVHAELHRLAQSAMSNERGAHVLQPTALVNEAFLRLMKHARGDWESRATFYAFSARLMRQILVDFARAQNRLKRGGELTRVALADENATPSPATQWVNIIDVDRALTELSELDERQGRMVELRYFGGLEFPEIASAMGLSEATVFRAWRDARAFLYSRLQLAALP